MIDGPKRTGSAGFALAFFLMVASFTAVAESYDEFWDDFHRNAARVGSCDSIASVVDFLEQALQHAGNAERGQAFAQVIEGLILDFPDCFCSAYIELPHDSLSRLKLFYLRSPLFHEKPEIDAALLRNKISRQCSSW